MLSPFDSGRGAPSEDRHRGLPLQEMKIVQVVILSNAKDLLLRALVVATTRFFAFGSE